MSKITDLFFWVNLHNPNQGIADAASDEYDKLLTERQEALDALKPFAVHGSHYSEFTPDEYAIINMDVDIEPAPITVGHCRRAAEVVKKLEG